MSTVTQLVFAAHKICWQVDIIILDCVKAFDKLLHGKLLYKLERLSMPRFIVELISSYLYNRRQFVGIEKKIVTPVLFGTSGVSQVVF